MKRSKLSLFVYVRRRLSLHSARSLLTGSAIALGVAAIFALIMIASAGTQTVSRSIRDDFGPTDISVMLGINGDPTILSERISALPGVFALLEQADQKLDKLPIKKGRSVGMVLRGIDTRSQILGRVYPLGDGRWPKSAGEVTLSSELARISGKKIGDRYRLNTGRRNKNLKVVGLVNDGRKIGGNILFVYASLANIRTIGGHSPNWQEIKVMLDRGADSTRVQRYIQGFGGVEKVTTLNEMLKEIRSGAVLTEGLFGLIGGIALFVGSFLIYTTFSITAAEREREYAIIRALGATRKDLRRLVYIEALIMGVIFSIVGLLLGGGLTFLLLWVARATKVTEGLDFSDLSISVSAVLPALTAGIIVTLISARGSARRAAGVMPAIGIRTSGTSRYPRRRLLIGTILLLCGLAATIYFIFGGAADPEGSMTGGVIGIFAIFFGIVLAMPALISPVLKAGAALLKKWVGIFGRLTALNLLRTPTRSANTTIMILVGTALVIMVAALSASHLANTEKTADRQLRFDLAITEEAEPIGIPTQTLTKIQKLPAVLEVTGFMLATPKVAARPFKPKTDGMGEAITIVGIDPYKFPQISSLLFRDNKPRTWADEATPEVWRKLSGNEVFADPDWAKMENLKVGDYLTLPCADGLRRRFRIAATARTDMMGGRQIELGKVYMSQTNVTKYFSDRVLLNHEVIGNSNLRFESMIKLAPGADPAIVKKRIVRLLKKDSSLKVVTAKNVRADILAQARGPLAFLYLIFGITLIIGLLGVINTVSVGIIERCREISFIRAVGASRRQVKQLVIGETILLTVLGTIFGTLLGAAIAEIFLKMPFGSQIASSLVFPWNTFFIIFAATIAASLAAAVYPVKLATGISVTDPLRYE